MNAEYRTEERDLSVRTKRYAIRILELVRSLPNSVTGRAVASQLVRCGTSIGANYRAARRARSRAEFISKLGIVIEEADETIFWLEIIIEGEMLRMEHVQPLLGEANEILSIMVASSKTAQAHQ